MVNDVMRMKTTVSITVDSRLVEAARSINGFNISSACERGLITALKIILPDDDVCFDDKLSLIEDKMSPKFKSRFIEALSKNLQLARGWMNLITIETGTPITKMETLALYGRLKSQQPQEHINIG